MSQLPNSKINSHAFASISEAVLFERVAGEFVLLDLDSGEYYGLDAVGSRIWDLIQCHDNLEEVLNVMIQEYEVDEDRLRGDLEEFVARLASMGFLETRDDTRQ